MTIVKKLFQVRSQSLQFKGLVMMMMMMMMMMTFDDVRLFQCLAVHSTDLYIVAA